MIAWLRHLLGWLIGVFGSRQDHMLENLAFVSNYWLSMPSGPDDDSRPRTSCSVLLRALWARWKPPLILVTPRTVVHWHRAGFQLYAKWISPAEPKGGREPISKQIRALTFQMVAENPTWGTPRIHGELLKLGFNLSEPTVSRWIRRAPKPQDPAKRWLTFLRNHRESDCGDSPSRMLG